jgi:hypothetical protein
MILLRGWQKTKHTQAINQKVCFYYLSFGCGLRKSLKLIGIWTRPAYCGLLINSPRPQFDFEKSRSVINSINRLIFICASPLRLISVPLFLLGGTKCVPVISETYFVVLSVFGQYLAIQPADCGHQNKFWSTGVRRATLRPV